MYLSTEHGAHHAHADTDGSPYLRWTAQVRASYASLHLKHFCCSVAWHRIATTWFAVLVHLSWGILPNTTPRDNGYRRLQDHFRRIRHLIGEQGWTSRRSYFTTTDWETLFKIIIISDYILQSNLRIEKNCTLIIAPETSARRRWSGESWQRAERRSLSNI